jgi:hypothetical protein
VVGPGTVGQGCNQARLHPYTTLVLVGSLPDCDAARLDGYCLAPWVRTVARLRCRQPDGAASR